jgi:hypothetical protein
MKASEVISHLKTVIHFQGDVEVKDVTPQTIEYHDEEKAFISLVEATQPSP